MRSSTINSIARRWRGAGPLTKGILVTIAAALTAGLPLLVVHDVFASGESVYRSAVAIFTNAVVIGYVFAVMNPSFRRLAGDVDRLAALLPEAVLSATKTQLTDRRATRGVWIARVAGVAYGALPNLGLATRIIEGRPEALMYSWVIVLLPLLWGVVFQALWRLLHYSWLIHRLGRDAVRVDFEDPRALAVFAEIGVRHLLLIALGLAFIPVQAILLGSLDVNDFALPLIVTIPVALVALGLPLLGIHHAIVAAKQAEVDRLTTLLRTAARNSDRYLLLSLYRRQITEMPEWPVTMGSAARGMFYLILPPLAWISAALVENWVSMVIG